MEVQNKFIQYYKDGFFPWAHEEPDFNLIEMVDNWPIKPCKTLEVGCGTGTDSVWLSQKGFQTTAYDLSPIAIEMANKQALTQKTSVDFKVFDFLTEKIKPGEFGFVFDRGFFHGFETETDRTKVAKQISKVLEKNGLWLSLIGNADGIKTDPGPPLRSAAQIVSSIESYFKILSIRASYFGNEEVKPARIWICLMRKR